MSERKSGGGGAMRAKMKMMQPVLQKFISKQFLTSYSLFNNLLSSQQLKIDIQHNDMLKTVFNAKTINERDLYEFSYFHIRDKLLIIYNYILQFLSTTTKLQMIIFLNCEKMDLHQLEMFLTSQKNNGKKQLWDEFKKRVQIFKIQNLNTYIFNLMYLSLLKKSKQFLRAIIICDINTFQSSDKSSLDKYYRKIPKEFAVLSFRKDFFEFKVIVKTALSFITEGDQQLTELNSKIINYVNKKSEHFSAHFAQIVPIEYVNNTSKTLQQTYRTVLFRSDGHQKIEQIVYQANPFKLQQSKSI